MSQENRPGVPLMIRFKGDSGRHKVGGEYDPQQQIRVVNLGAGTVPYIQTKDIKGMASTHTGERANEH